MIFKTRMTGIYRRAVLSALAAAAIALFVANTAGWGYDGNIMLAEYAPPGKEQGGVSFPRPESHNGNWMEYHGSSAELNVNEAGQRGKACYSCHEWNDCIACHNTRMPRDHTNTWRTLSHGFVASGNRERCLTCHKEDYCVRCHNETAPRTHVGNWITRHCTWCHYETYPVPADNCRVCHRQALHVIP